MDVRIGSKDGPPASLVNLADQVNSEVRAKEPQWLETLVADPGQLAEVEQEIHLTFGKLADHAVAAVLAKASERPELQTHQKKESWIRRRSRFGGRRSGR